MKTLQQIFNMSISNPLDSILSQLKQFEAASDNLTKVSAIYFLNNFTIAPVENYLKYYLYHSEIKHKIVFGDYNNAMQELLNQESNLYKSHYDIVVCSLMYHCYDPLFLNRLLCVEDFINELKILFDLVAERTSATILINTIIPPTYTEVGGDFCNNSGDRFAAIAQCNAFIRNYVRDNHDRFVLMDWVRYVQILGEENSFDLRYWYMFKAPFKKHFLSYYALDIVRVIRILNGLTNKCLVLDCDNTLWGGVIGEDGLDGIKLDNHDYPSKIYFDFQQTVLDLYQRGIIITLCSKNNESDVWEVFDKHPQCLLRREHIAHFKINWLNKAENIAALANELNISLSSMVVVDDSKAECELIKYALPEVTVLQVPQPIYEYPQLLLKECLFDVLAMNKEDLNRTRMYQQEFARKQSYSNAKNIDEYLSTLSMVATIHEIRESEISRVAQLTQKTNQFNLSGRRYSQQQIRKLSEEGSYRIYTLHVKDKFGDSGLTGVFIGKVVNQKGFIENFLLSCRVLGRNLEFVFLEYCLNEVSNCCGLSNWEAEYIPSGKNIQVETFLEKAFFKRNNNIFNTNMSEVRPSAIHYIQVLQEEICNV